MHKYCICQGKHLDLSPAALRPVELLTVGSSANVSMHFLLEAVIAASEGVWGGHRQKSKTCSVFKGNTEMQKLRDPGRQLPESCCDRSKASTEQKKR